MEDAYSYSIKVSNGFATPPIYSVDLGLWEKKFI